MLKNKFLRTPVERSVSKSALSRKPIEKELNMKIIIQVITVIVGHWWHVVSTGLAQQPDSSASKQLKNTAKNTARFDGGPGSTINTSTATTTHAPAVVDQAVLQPAFQPRRHQRRDSNTLSITIRTRALPSLTRSRSQQPLTSRAPPPPAPAPKPQPKKSLRKPTNDEGTVPTEGNRPCLDMLRSTVCLIWLLMFIRLAMNHGRGFGSQSGAEVSRLLAQAEKLEAPRPYVARRFGAGEMSRLQSRGDI